MRRRSSFFILLPLLIAVAIISLPGETNQRLLERGGNVIAKLFHFGSKNPSERKVLAEEPLHEWFQEEDESRCGAAEENQHALPHNCPLIIGKVILRSAHSWSSSLWIDIGSDDNPQDSLPIVCKNSPVLSNGAVVGVIDYVGKRTSLVRLITDPQLTPAVRVARGLPEAKRQLTLLDELLEHAAGNFNSKEDEATFFRLATELRMKLKNSTETRYLAKGELQGHGEPIFRSPGKYLKGVGFNYDFSDAYGPSRELRSGIKSTQGAQEPLIQTNDLLVTSGLDGVFPEGLPIARVASIAPLREGAIAYEITATPCANDIYDLRYVAVMAPQKVPEEIER